MRVVLCSSVSLNAQTHDARNMCEKIQAGTAARQPREEGEKIVEGITYYKIIQENSVGRNLYLVTLPSSG